MIRLVDLAQRHAAVAADLEPRVLAVLRSGQYVGGPVVAEAEALAARWLGRRHAVGVNSGTDALTLALLAVGVRAGDEVIVPALSFFATAGAVLALGAVPVVADVGADACLDPRAAANLRSERTRAVIPVHLFGTLAAAPDLGVPIVDDAAQGIGGEPKRAIGDLTALSTYPTKTWGGAGDGGFVIGDDADLIARVRLLGNHGKQGDAFLDVHGATGRNSRLDALQAAVLLSQATDLAQRIERRRALAAFYDANLPTGAQALPRDAGSPVHHYLVLVPDRAGVAARMTDGGVETRIYYPRPLTDEPALGRQQPTPVATWLSQRLLALPVHAGLTDEDATRVLHALEQALP